MHSFIGKKNIPVLILDYICSEKEILVIYEAKKKEMR